jgi:hypothetical protein
MHVEIGDLLEADVNDGKIFAPKSLIDQYLKQGLEHARKGRTHGPYGRAKEAIAALDLRANAMLKSAGREAALYGESRKGLCGPAGQYPQGAWQATGFPAEQSGATGDVATLRC